MLLYTDDLNKIIKYSIEYIRNFDPTPSDPWDCPIPFGEFDGTVSLTNGTQAYINIEMTTRNHFPTIEVSVGVVYGEEKIALGELPSGAKEVSDFVLYADSVSQIPENGKALVLKSPSKEDDLAEVEKMLKRIRQNAPSDLMR